MDATATLGECVAPLRIGPSPRACLGPETKGGFTMRSILRARLVAALAVLALIPVAEAAASDYYYVEPAGEVTVASLGRVTFAAGGYTITCNMTLETEIEEAPFEEVTEDPIGEIVGVETGECSGGTLTRSLELPWQLRYERTLGTLPEVTGFELTVDEVAANFNVLGLINCLYVGALSALLTVREGEEEDLIPGLIRIDETRTMARGEGSNGTCPNTGTMRAEFAFEAETIVPEPVWVVSLGDSYISGEAGRWAGNTARYSENEYRAIDALGRGAYWDNAMRTEERIPRCHRSRAAEIHIGGGVESLNLACSGGKTWSYLEGSYWRAGLDFESRSGTQRGQLLQLQEFAQGWARHIRMIVLSIGGNDFGFGGVVEQCVLDFLLFTNCNTREELNRWFEAEEARIVKERIRTDLIEIRRVMREAGADDDEYKILVQNYMSPIPEEGGRFRYEETYTRHNTGGCGIYNADAAWANERLLPVINRTIAEAVTAAGLPNTITLDLSNAFAGRRLCETGVGLLEEMGHRSWAEQPESVDRAEWIQMIRINVAGTPFYIQESIHPNFWGQLALRNCIRQAYNGGSPRGGRCTRSGTGLTNGEPRMRLE